MKDIVVFQITWDPKLADKDSELYQQLSYEALRAVSTVLFVLAGFVWLC